MADVFCSYSRSDQHEVTILAQQLIDRDLDVYLDQWYLQPGEPWPQVLAAVLSDSRSVAVFVGQGGLGGWQQREVFFALDLQVKDTKFPVIPVLLPKSEPALGFLAINTWVDLRSGIQDEDAIDLLASAIKREPPPRVDRGVGSRAADLSPFRGLRPFREEDAPLFFGRDVFVQALSDAVSRQPLVAVVGPSGSGKSSVLMAGLIPRLRQDSGTVWEVVTFIPGQRPWHASAAAFISTHGPELSMMERIEQIGRISGSLINEELTLRDLADEMLLRQPGTERILVAVDQWEELYTLATDRLAKDFTNAIIDLSEHPAVSVVITLRSDFYGHVLRHRSLADRLQASVVNISTMTQSELQEAITGPADTVGLKFDHGLVHRVLNDVGEEPGNLPLLEFVLDELWKARV